MTGVQTCALPIYFAVGIQGVDEPWFLLHAGSEGDVFDAENGGHMV